jgi:CRISPR-associated protein Cmr2
MKRDFVAAYDLVQYPDHIQRQVVDYLVGAASPPREAASLAAVDDQLARIQLLPQALATFTKTYAQTSDHRNRPAGLRRAIQSKVLDAFFAQQRETYLEPLGLWPADPPALTILPRYSFALQFTFALRKPYLSQDDVDWYIIDNPVRKEKVFGVPLVAPTGWKGALRAAAARRLAEKAADWSVKDFARERLRLTRLFGDEKGEEPDEVKAMARFLDKAREDAGELYRRKVKKYFNLEPNADVPHHAGRLRFFPTFFTQIGLEVINPHDRKTGAGTLPIYFECVPQGAEGTFTLLYVPFDLLGRPEAEVQAEVAADLDTVAEAVQAMFTEYGFGAKTTSGFGVAEGGFPPSEGEKHGGLVRVHGVGGYRVGGFAGLRKAVEVLKERLESSDRGLNH